ncbi:DNA replication protein DnaC [Roseimicrobium gellanilyticum]|uniref:DNA replication protein DnaC n=1 Tax=Roseimicrobium gellanilyticum TaxID=748857 RepID=A0A366H5K3_9BACT|nr:ATP-binding protein [Roseimicrobium gellanilyticum]RBP36922.1 DNA replication protein DnaC [Roseimicrobium gellanilyticum]
MSERLLCCSRCGGPVEGVDAMEAEALRSVFNRAPLLLCGPCEKADAEELAKKRAPRQARVPQAWPEEWPRRSIADLEHFREAPLRMARTIQKNIEANRGTFVILGDRGRGKTVMATWLAEQRRQQGQSPGVYVRSHDLFATIRRAWHPQSKEDEWAVLEHYRKTPFLVIDEFQERSESEWENRTLVNILDHRHGNILPTVLIANLSADAFGKSVGASMVDRISQTGGIVECGWGGLRG